MRLLIALALLLVPALAPARAPREMIEIRAGEPVSIRPDRAYLLFRTDRPEGVHAFEPIFLRIPSAEEMARYDAARRAAYALAEPGLIRRHEQQLQRNRERGASGDPVDPPPSLETFDFVYDEIQNLQHIDAARALARGRPESLYLVEVVPGDYVLYGVTWEAGPPVMSVCMCLGTVGFSARPGVVTDLGQFVADTVHEVSAIPELRAESGFGPSIYGYRILIGATVRPARPGLTIPAALRGAEIRPADYHAVGKFLDPGAMAINRLAPVPGVLAYDGGRVVDVASGRAVPDNY
jgi:hypothetical protein